LSLYIEERIGSMKNTTLKNTAHAFRIWSVVGLLIVIVYVLYRTSPVPYQDPTNTGKETFGAFDRVAHHFDAQTRTTDAIKHFIYEVGERMVQEPHARYYDCQDIITLDIVAAAAQNTPGLHPTSREFVESLRTALIRLVMDHPNGPCKYLRQVSARTLGDQLKHFALSHSH
jgi:hypothetical protein